MPQDLINSHFTGSFRVGRVSSVDANAHTAQVQFFEVDGLVSFGLNVLATHPGDYSLFAKDALVLCVILDGELARGFVLGALYSDSDTPPLSDESQRSIAGDDIRLGDPAATDKIALGPKVKDELDKIGTEIGKIKTTLSSLTGGVSVPATFATPYTGSYSASDPSAEKVKAK
jgi:phage baseplate assembly protein gpV